VAKIVGTVNENSGILIVASWHIKPLKIVDPEVIFAVVSGAVNGPAIVTVWGSYDPDIDYSIVSNWQEFQSVVTVEITEDVSIDLTGNIIDRKQCWNKQAVSIRIPENISLITVTVEGSDISEGDTATYNLILTCKEDK